MFMNNNKKPNTSDGLGRLLRQVRVPSKTDDEWQRLENDLFIRLDEQTAPQRSTGVTFAFPRFGAAWAATAALVALSLLGSGVYVAKLSSRQSPSTAGIIHTRGNIMVALANKDPLPIVSLKDNAALTRIIPAGTAISTPDSSSAIIRLDKNSALELLPGSHLVLKKSNASRQLCYLSSGSVLVKVNKRTDGQRFEIQTSTAICRIVGTVFRVDAFDGHQTALSVYQGKVELTPLRGTLGKRALVETGRRLTVSRDKEPVDQMLSDASAPIHDISVLGMLAEEDTKDHAVIEVTSLPNGAKVMVDGEMAGTTPLLIKKRLGDYSVAVYGDGFLPWKKRVTLGSDRFVGVYAPLTPAGEVRRPVPGKKAYTPALAPRRQCEAELALIPEYIEALVDISSGEYQRALGLFDSLWNSGIVDIKGRMCLMEKLNACYAKLGDFNKAVETLEERYQKAQTPRDKGQLLWEMATMRANCLGDYQGAEMALVEFLILQPDALWAHNAYSKLAEIQYYLNKFGSAAETYAKHIATFPDDPDIDRSMYNLARILQIDLNKCEKAVRWYSRLINSFPAGKYYAAAFFRRGECELQMGKPAEAQRDFNKYLSLAPHGMWREACMVNSKKHKQL
jgi:hypothetical protein